MRFVTDTHCLLWYLQGDKRLSTASRRLFDGHDKAKQVVIPTIVLAELLHLSRKYQVPFSFEKLLASLAGDERYDMMSLTVEVIREAMALGPLEMHDALIVATALHLDIPLMTRDQEIVDSGVIKTIEP